MKTERHHNIAFASVTWAVIQLSTLIGQQTASPNWAKPPSLGGLAHGVNFAHPAYGNDKRKLTHLIIEN